MDINNKREIEIFKNKDITLASSNLAKRGMEIISDLVLRRIHVPKDYHTIAEAVDHAVDGDTIELAGGIYHESLRITKPVTIIGARNSRVTLTSLNLSPIIKYDVNHGISKVKNIIFERASAQNSIRGIVAEGDSFEFEDCTFEGFNSYEDYADHDDNEKYELSSAVNFFTSYSKVKFFHCNFNACELGIYLNDKSCIDLYDCNFSPLPYKFRININCLIDCTIRSHKCFFSNGTITLTLGCCFESNYDTFVDVLGIITPFNSGPKATFSHATFVSNCLLQVGAEKGFDPSDMNFWEDGKKPIIHFLNSIVVIKPGYKPRSFTNIAGKIYITYDSSSIKNMATEGILYLSEKNLIYIPPYFVCQDPLLIFENNIARLSPNSPAIKSASDGTNLGAWQGD